MNIKVAAIWTVVALGIIGIGLSTAYAVTTAEPSNFLRTFGCSLSK